MAFFRLYSGAFFGKGFCLRFDTCLGSFECGLNTCRFLLRLATHFLGFGFGFFCRLGFLPHPHFRFALCFCGSFQFRLYTRRFLFCLKTTGFSTPPGLLLGITLCLDALRFLLGAQSSCGFSLFSGFRSLPLRRFLFDFCFSLGLGFGRNFSLLSGDCCSLQLLRLDRLQPACLAFFLSNRLGCQILSAGRLEHTGEVQLSLRIR